LKFPIAFGGRCEARPSAVFVFVMGRYLDGLASERAVFPPHSALGNRSGADRRVRLPFLAVPQS